MATPEFVRAEEDYLLNIVCYRCLIYKLHNLADIAAEEIHIK
jgi:hypothetical protein